MIRRAGFERPRRGYPGAGRLLVEYLAGQVRRLPEHLTEALFTEARTRVLRRLHCARRARPAASQLTKADWRRAIRGHSQTMDQYMSLLGLPSGGALRVSVGLASNADDIERFAAFVEMTYQDRCPVPADLRHRQAADLRCLSLSGNALGGCGRWSANGCEAFRRGTTLSH